MSTALYRRYRPETFEEVVGQEHVTVPLMAALEGDRTNHAYLFSGPRGCGKTTSARILARCLNCAEGPTATPCGECESCVELARGGSGSLDVVEMDAASHGGVDDARELRERASFAPLRDRYKVFIIDEAHMVSNQGFNALLKLVEEPPPHVKFVFATTEPDKVIGTIRSRTHHYPFRLVPPGILEDYLADLATQEDVEVADGVLPLVVRAGSGSVRDSLSVLDQLMGGAPSNSLDYQTAVSLLGYTDGALLDTAVDAIAAIDGGALFGAVASVVESGHDPRRFVEDLLERLRDLVVIALVGEGARDVLSTVPEDQFERMVDQAERLTAQRASKCADLANTALSDMAGATSPRLQLELLCARLLLAANTPSAPGTAPATGLSDARAAALSFKKPAKPETPRSDKPAPATPGRVVPESGPAAAPAPSQQAPERVVPEPSKQEPGRLVPQADQRSETPASQAPVAKPAGSAVEEASTEPELSDAEKLDALRSMWREAMADSRVPRGTSDFIRDHGGKVSVVSGVLRFDFPDTDQVNRFVGDKRSTGLETVFSEMLGKPLNVDVGVIGVPPQSGRESSDDTEGDSRPVVANPATSTTQNYARNTPDVRNRDVSAPDLSASGSSATATASNTSPHTAGSSTSPDIAPVPQAMPMGGNPGPGMREPAQSSALSPAQAAVARAVAKSAGSRSSAASADYSAEQSLSGSPAGSAVSAPEWDDQVPPDDEYPPYDDAADQDPAEQSKPARESTMPRGLPADLPDIVMDDFPAPPPAAMPKFPAPPPRQAPGSGITGGTAASPSAGAFARLTQARTAPEAVAAPEEELDVETEHEMVSKDDPLALDGHGIGLDVVLEVLQARIIEEVTEES